MRRAGPCGVHAPWLPHSPRLALPPTPFASRCFLHQRTERCTTGRQQQRRGPEPCRPLPVPLRAASAAASQPAEPAKPAPTGLRALFTPLSDPACNARWPLLCCWHADQHTAEPLAACRLIALCTAQMLCSVATLIHDTYLPVYLQDQLGMSNSKVRPCSSSNVHAGQHVQLS